MKMIGNMEKGRNIFRYSGFSFRTGPELPAGNLNYILLLTQRFNILEKVQTDQIYLKIIQIKKI